MSESHADGAGLAVIAEAEVEVGAISPRDPASLAVGASLAEGVRRLRADQESAGRCEVEGVHKMRGAARFLRSELVAFRPLIDPGAAEGLADELRWLSGTLGAVRDLHVLRAYLRDAAGEACEALSPLFESLDRHYEMAAFTLGIALRGDRCRDLLARLSALARDPSPTDEAGGPCREVLPPRVAASWRKLKKRGRALDHSDPDEAFHEVRKYAKRARFAAEAVAPVLGSSSRKCALRFARLAKGVQDALGTHQDAVIARAAVGRVAAEHQHDGAFNLAAGRLLEKLDHAAREARDDFPAAWSKLDRKKHLRWLKP